MKLPCKDCLTLPLCKNLDLHDLARKCSFISKYLKVNRITEKPINKTVSIYRIFSGLKPFIHRSRMNKIKQLIPHSHKLD
jgi:hypothetical protein